METDVFLQALKKNFREGLDLMIKKNSDYSRGTDAFANFKTSELVQVPVERGILVRIMDKVSRISNLLDGEAEVKDESLEQTVLDAMNYFNLLLTYIQQKETVNVAGSKDTD